MTGVGPFAGRNSRPKTSASDQDGVETVRLRPLEDLHEVVERLVAFSTQGRGAMRRGTCGHTLPAGTGLGSDRTLLRAPVSNRDVGPKPETPAGKLVSIVEPLRRWPRLTLAVAYASWWWWVWVPWSERFYVRWEFWGTIVPFVLVLFGAWATALASGRHRRLVCAALLTSPAFGVPAVVVVNATGAFAAGRAELLVAGYPESFLPYGSVDPGTRIPQRGSGCMGPPFHAPIHNGTLRMLDALVGPMPRTYQGPLPNEPEALAALEDRGTDLRSACADHKLSVEGLSMVFPPDDDPVCSWNEPLRDGQRHCVPRRVAAINEDLVAVEHRAVDEFVCGLPEATCSIDMVHLGSGRTLGTPPTADHR